MLFRSLIGAIKVVLIRSSRKLFVDFYFRNADSAIRS
jgi:hypothetical protein